MSRFTDPMPIPWEPRSYSVLAYTPVFALTVYLGTDDYTVWAFGKVHACGSRDLMVEIYNGLVPPHAMV